MAEPTALIGSAGDEHQALVAQMRALLYSAADLVRPDKRSEFEERMSEYLGVLDELLDEYAVELRSAPQQRLQAEGKLFAALWQNADLWSKSVRLASNGGWGEIKDEWHTVRSAFERKDRQRAFAVTNDEAEFRQQLWWMTEAGAHDDENLPLVRQARRESRFPSIQLNMLLARTEERIVQRFYAPEAVVEREERAYQQYRSDWDDQYRGRQIAIHLGKVIAAHSDRAALIELLRRRQQETGPLRAYIVQIGGHVLDCTNEGRPFFDDAKP